MDQGRLEPIREGAQFVARAVTSSAAHDDDAAGLIDPAGNFGNILVAHGDFLTRLQRCHAGDVACRRPSDHILRKRQVGDAAARIGGRYRLMDDRRRLRRGGDSFGVERDIAKQKIGRGCLDVVGALVLAHHVAGNRQDRRMVETGFIKAGDQMRAAGAGGTGAHRELPRKLGLTGGGERRPFLVAHTDPFDIAATNRVRQRVQRVGDQSEDMLDAGLLEHGDEDIRNRFSHLPLLFVSSPRSVKWHGRCLRRDRCTTDHRRALR